MRPQAGGELQLQQRRQRLEEEQQQQQQEQEQLEQQSDRPQQQDRLQQQQQQQLHPPRPRKRSSADLGPAASASAGLTSLMLGSQSDVEAYLDAQDQTYPSPSHSHLSASPSAHVTAASSIDDSTYGVQSINESLLVDPEAAPSASSSPVATTAKTAEAAVVEEPEDIADMGNEEIARLMARRRSTIRPVQSQQRRGSTSGISSISGYTNDSSSHASPAKGRDKGRDRVALSRDPSDVHLNSHLTPLSHASPSALSDGPPSPRSSILLQSDDELETGSQALLSSDGEEEEEADADAEKEQATSTTETSSTGLQLVMPSLMMPSRRPFTERGKQLGRLKVLLTGAAGVGKTSLIKSIVQTCEDIVHIDSQTPSSSQTLARRSSKKSHQQPAARSTQQVTEVAGSTKPYPGWWAKVEESQVLRRHRSGSEEVLERNVCFIDTPGYDKASPKMLESMEDTLLYLQTQMLKAISPSSMHDSELLGFLGGSGGAQVDAILFLLDSRPTSVEVEYYEQISKLAHVIPILSKSDLVLEEGLEELRSGILQSLSPVARRPSEASTEDMPEIFSICSSPSNDLEAMDASLLMSSGYVEPLQPSQLGDLTNHLFHPENAAFFKHVAAKRLVAWRHASPQSMAVSPSPLRTNMFVPTLPRSTSSSSGSHHHHNRHNAPLSPTSAALTYTASRLRDHKEREERTAQVQLGHWADALRRNLAAERLRFEQLANREREQWLQDRLDECIFDGKVTDANEAWALGGPRPRRMRGCVVRPTGRKTATMKARRGNGADVSGGNDDPDPLAIMRWRRRILAALQVVGGVSVAGALALCLARATCDLKLYLEWFDDYGVARLQEMLGFQAFRFAGGSGSGR